jgi:DNA-binding SARP family transcriptional activator
MLEFRILGPLEVVGEKGPIRLGGPKQRATLAILLLSANRVVSIDRLAEDLYAGAPPVTAVTQVQRQVSDLRKAFGSAEVIETRSPGYLIPISAEQLDLDRFERTTEEAGRALAGGDARAAADLLRNALALWRGAPLADLAYEPFAQSAIDRLEEIRLAALEQRIEADLALGRHAALIGELEQLVFDQPLRERSRAQLMLALYRSGRQAEALDVYRRTRAALVDEFGIEPSPALHELERAILGQDPSLDLRSDGSPSVERAGALLALPGDEDGVERVLAIAEPLAKVGGRELIVVRLLSEQDDVSRAASTLNARRESLGVASRAAAFTTLEPARDVVRLAATYEVQLVLLDAPPGLSTEHLPDDLAVILERSSADVGVVAGPAAEFGDAAPVLVPFGGGEHDWAALELAAWLCSATGARLQLAGTKADLGGRRRDASRLLADASLAVQRVAHVDAEPLLAEPSDDALVHASEQSSVVVIGISPRWRHEGIGSARRAILEAARAPTLIVHHGPRPGGLAPPESRTRFTWSIEA